MAQNVPMPLVLHNTLTRRIEELLQAALHQSGARGEQDVGGADRRLRLLGRAPQRSLVFLERAQNRSENMSKEVNTKSILP